MCPSSVDSTTMLVSGVSQGNKALDRGTRSKDLPTSNLYSLAWVLVGLVSLSFKLSSRYSTLAPFKYRIHPCQIRPSRRLFCYSKMTR
mmetsp:Transcript_8491/g.29039  ORF Transcript_8491/g.29039 Transcript_8491/m.29039 type:complete len:88 (+) Transcript_8491:3899-4162(+)